MRSLRNLSQRDGHRAILSRNGEVWIAADVDRLEINLDTRAPAILKDGKWGLMDTTGNVAIVPTYDEPVNFRPSFRGIGWIGRDGLSCPIDRHGQDDRESHARAKPRGQDR